MMKKETGSTEAGLLLAVLAIVWAVAAWLTHVIVCLKAGTWGFLIAGAIFFPIALIHGTGAWFGAW